LATSAQPANFTIGAGRIQRKTYYPAGRTRTTVIAFSILTVNCGP